MNPHASEWLNLAVRWIHFITGVAWIGASFYFNWLENRLDRRQPRDGLAGNLWAVHGGGFYYLEKYRVAPPKLPEELHWFKWEAYFTWISGVCLLAIVYYINPATYLVDPAVREIPGSAAVGIVILADHLEAVDRAAQAQERGRVVDQVERDDGETERDPHLLDVSA